MFELKKQLMWSKLKVGIIITMAIMILLFTVFFANGLEKILSPTIDIRAHIKDVKGLRQGSPVWFSGIEIGAVKRIDLHAEKGTLVTMSIKKDKAQFIKKDSIASVQTMGLLGDKYIEISTGSSDVSSISPEDIIEGAEYMEFKDVIKTGSEALKRITEFVGEMDSFIKKMDKVVDAINNSKFLKDPTLYNNLEEASRNLAYALRDLRESEGTMKKIIQDPSMYNKMLSAASSLEEFGRRMNEGSGTLRKLSEDPSLYENLNKATLQLNSVLEKIDSGEGLAGSLLKDKELPNELRETVSELKTLSRELGELTKDIKSNPKKYFKFSIF